MDDNTLQKLWAEQPTSSNTMDNPQLLARITCDIKSANQTFTWLAIGAGALVVLTGAWLTFWTYLLATVGVTTMQERDWLLPLGPTFITPAWVGLLAVLFLAQHLAQRAHRHDFDSTLSGSLARARSLVRYRLFIWKAAPIALASAILVTGSSLIFSTEFQHLLNISPLMTAALMIPDFAILAFLTYRLRRSRKQKLEPQLAEIEATLTALRST